tara:strand:+ start:2286 stop:3554 length:1269 start_codon:yes stop_codon:yes gene_type:complete
MRRVDMLCEIWSYSITLGAVGYCIFNYLNWSLNKYTNCDILLNSRFCTILLLLKTLNKAPDISMFIHHVSAITLELYYILFITYFINSNEIYRFKENDEEYERYVKDLFKIVNINISTIFLETRKYYKHFIIDLLFLLTFSYYRGIFTYSYFFDKFEFKKILINHKTHYFIIDKCMLSLCLLNIYWFVLIIKKLIKNIKKNYNKSNKQISFYKWNRVSNLLMNTKSSKKHQELLNAFTMVLPASIMLFRKLTDKVAFKDEEWTAWLVIGASLLHAPFSIIYHVRSAYEMDNDRLDNFWRRSDQSAIHITSILYTIALSRSVNYSILSLVFNGYSIKRLYAKESDSIGAKPRIRILMSVVMYTLPIFWYGDKKRFTKSLQIFTFASTCFVLSPQLLGYGHSLFHLCMIEFGNIILSFCETMFH